MSLQLKTPKKYQPKGRRRHLFRSWRWLRNLILIGILVAGGYWIINNRELFRNAVGNVASQAGERVGEIQISRPTPTPTPNVTGALAEAVSAYSLGDFDRAIDNYRVVISGNPNDVDSHYRLAYLLVITSSLGADEAKMQEALEVSEKTINANPEDPHGWAVRAMVLNWLDRPGEAIAYANVALELNPDFVEAKAYLAEAYQRSALNNPRLVETSQSIAVATIDEAIEDLRRMGAASPETIAQVFRAKGWISEYQLDRDTAIEYYERALEAAPNLGYIALELALSYYANNQTEDGIALLKSALESNPRDTAILFRLGALYTNVGNGEEAQQSFQRCIEIDPDNYQCLSWLGGLRYASQSYAQAIPLLENAISNGSKDPIDWLQLGRSHFYLLRCDLAIPVLNEGYVMTADDPTTQDKFADTLKDCGAALPQIVPTMTPEVIPVEITPEATP